MAPQNHKRKTQETVKGEKGQITSSHKAFSLLVPPKPLTNPQKSYIKDHRSFLVRNYERIRRIREAFHMITSSKDEEKSVVSNLYIFCNSILD